MKKVLILDDERSLRLILKLMIEKTGEYEIFETDSLSEAITLCKNNKFEAIFLDHNVTDGIGWKIAEEIKKDPKPYGSPKVIGMSGSVPYDEKRCIFDFYMEKPFSASEVMPKISGLLSGER